MSNLTLVVRPQLTPEFRYRAEPAPKSVSVAVGFNNWNTKAHPLTHSPVWYASRVNARRLAELDGFKPPSSSAF